LKLVRNRIPRMIEESGKTPRCHVADLEEFTHRLEDKMKEELQEFFEKPCLEEAADMYEVLRCLCWLNRLDMEDVINEADLKRVRRGGFNKGIVLESIDEAHEENDDWSTTSQGELA